MDEKLIENWNAKVGPRDIIYILGDVSFATPHKTVEYLNRLNGTLRLVAGNHDSWKYTKYNGFRERFDWVKLYNVEKFYKQHFIMFHFPMLEWDKKFYGSVHLHGHTHSKNPDVLDCRRVDVGLDSSPDFSPYLLEDVIKIINERYEGGFIS